VAEFPEADDPLAEFGASGRAYVVPKYKLLYISTAKNACTSLKWLIAELAGEDLARFRPGLSPTIVDGQAVHQRHLFEHTPRLDQISADLRRTISPDNGWFVFSVLRDPRVRLFSAWENKMLMHNPHFRRFRHEAWYPPVPVDAEDVVRSFAQFVDLLDKQPDHEVHLDTHFASQTSLVRRDIVTYSKLYEISELNSALLPDLATHLRTFGWDGELTLRRSNDTPLWANGQALTEPICSQIERIYADDFANFGTRWDLTKVLAAPEWTPAALGELTARTALGERIGELLVEARRATRRAEKLSLQLDKRTAQLQAAREELRAIREQQPAPEPTRQRRRWGRSV
jgi:uncharacterized membrane-anchored protein YhcB (DUF1043 family)